MKITVLRSDINSKLVNVSRFVSSRAQLPIVSNILLRAKGSKLVLQATNLEMSASVNVGAKIEEEGEITLPAKTLTDLIQSLSGDQIEINVTDESAIISSNTSNTTLTGTNSSEFPVVPDVIKGKSIELGDEFLDGLAQVIFSASPDDTRPALAAVLVDFGTDSSLVTSDGFRLSQYKLKINNIEIKKRIILPKNIMNEVVKISKTEGKIKLHINEEENQVLFEIGDYLLASRIVDGEYPKFEKIIPTSSKIEARLSKSDLLNSLKTVSVVAREGANVAEFVFNEEGIVIKSQNSKGAVGEVNIAAKVQGGNISISFNYKFVIDFLNVISGENIIIKLNDSTSPGVFLDEGDSNFLHLIMPVRD